MGDSELLRAFANAASEKAFSELVERHITLVYSTALRCVGGDAHLAKDVSQSVFTDLAKKAKSLTERTSLDGWLHTSTRYAASRVVRSERRRRVREEEYRAMNQSAAAEIQPAWDQLRPVLDEVLGKLNEIDREAILLRFFKDLSFADVGQKLALSENAARMRVDRAIDKLHHQLAKRGVVSTATALSALLATGVSAAAVPTGLVTEITSTALAGAATATGGLTQLLTAIKLQVGIASGLAIIGTGLCVVQADKIKQLTTESSISAQQFRSDNDRLIHVRSQRLAEQKNFPVSNAVVQAFAYGKAAEPMAPADLLHLTLALRVRGSVSESYAGLWRELKLPPQRRQAMEDLVVKKTLIEIAVLHNMAIGEFAGFDANDPMARSVLKAAATSYVDEDIRRTIGDEAFASYTSYFQTLTIRKQAAETANRLARYGQMPSDEQIDQICQLVGNADSDPASLIGDDFIEKHSTALAPDQLAVLKAMQSERLLRRQILEMNHDAAVKGLISPVIRTGAQLNDSF